MWGWPIQFVFSGVEVLYRTFIREIHGSGSTCNKGKKMLRKWILGTVSVMAAAAFLMGTPDSAWARRCCRNRCSNGGMFQGNNCGGCGGGLWNRGGYSTGCSSGCGTSCNACGTAAAPMNNMAPTYTQGTIPSQPYSTGYAPTYDGNGNLINNGQNGIPANSAAPNAPAPAPAPAAPTPVTDK